MATDLADYSQAVNVQGGSVSISGTATVQITGTPTVSISGTPTVNVGNTPSVTISSGTVTATISGTPNINIQSQSVLVQVNQPPTALTGLNFTNVVSTQTTDTVPAGTHSLRLANTGSQDLNGVTIRGHTTGTSYWPTPDNANALIHAGEIVNLAVDSATDSKYDITGSTTLAGGTSLHVSAILDVQAVYVYGQRFAPLFTIPNPADVTGFSAPAAGSNASVVLAATAGKAYTAHDLHAVLLSVAALAAGFVLTLKDGGNVIFSSLLGFPTNNNAMAALTMTEARYPGSAGNSMTFAFTGSLANLDQAVNIAAFLK